MKRGRGITLLVPFTPGLSADRDRLWCWLERYWHAQLPHARVVMGRDATHRLAQPGVPFCKTGAVNDAASRADGDILVILDADAYVPHTLILRCAAEIRYARAHGRRLWFVPYRRFYRVSREGTDRVLASSPRSPWQLGDPPPPAHLDAASANPRGGHHYAAMIMILPAEGFAEVGGMDPRFQGWGGEDISFMRAVDTVYSPHKTVDRPVFHLHHSTIGQGINRQWQGQTRRMPFAVLGSRYQAAYGDRARMLRLIAEWREP